MQTPLLVFQSPPWPASHWHFPSPISHTSLFPSKWPCSSYRTIYSFLFVVYPATCRNTASSYFFPGHFILFAIYYIHGQVMPVTKISVWMSLCHRRSPWHLEHKSWPNHLSHIILNFSYHLNLYILSLFLSLSVYMCVREMNDCTHVHHDSNVENRRKRMDPKE